MHRFALYISTSRVSKSAVESATMNCSKHTVAINITTQSKLFINEKVSKLR